MHRTPDRRLAAPAVYVLRTEQHLDHRCAGCMCQVRARPGPGQLTSPLHPGHTISQSAPQAPEARHCRCRSPEPEAFRALSELTSHPVAVRRTGIGYWALAGDSHTDAAGRSPRSPLPLEIGPQPVFRTALNHSKRKPYKQDPGQAKSSFSNLRDSPPPVTLRLCLQSRPSNAAIKCASGTKRHG